MAKYVANVTFEVTAKDSNEAMEKAKEVLSVKKSVVSVASTLREIPHPVHLLDAEVAFGSINYVPPVEDEDG